MKKDLMILFLLILPVIAPLFQLGYFAIHDDLQTMRQYQLHKCVQDGQIPCRWINDMGYGYGFPLFNFYPPGPYLLGHAFVMLGISYINTAKIIGIIGFLAAGFTMYLFGKEFWGRRGGIVAAAIYTYAPYRAVNFYVRAAVNEFWATIFFPAILLGIYKIIKTPKLSWMMWTALAVSGLMLSHNQMLMIFAPVALVWTIYWWWREGWFKSFKHLSITAVWGVGLAAFYLLPAIFEQKYVHIESLVIGYFNYLAHFIDLKQMFLNINWGYGSSILGPEDGMSFALGYVQWVVPLIVLVGLGFSKKLRQNIWPILIFVFATLWALFMAHSKSTPIWKIFTPLEYLQFPWRFMSLAMFTATAAAGAIALVKKKFLLTIIVALVIALNGNYFYPRVWYPDITDEIKFSGFAWYLLTTNGIFDYLPKWTAAPPADPPVADAVFVLGAGSIETIEKRTNRQSYSVKVEGELAIAEIQTYYFPGWRAWLDGQELVLDPTRDKLLGRMQIDVPAGSHIIEARFTNTPIRTFSNMLTLLSLAALGSIILVWRKK